MVRIHTKIIFLSIVGAILCLSFLIAPNAKAANVDQTYPRLANYFLKWEINETEARELAKWDVVILDMEVQYRNPDLIKKIREWNPGIILLVYITPQEIKADAASSFSMLRRKLHNGIHSDWYLRDSGGKKLSWWQGTYLLNVSQDAPVRGGKRLNTYIASFVSEELLSSGLWDGVFYDNSWDNITYFAGSDIDMNLDGRTDYNPDTRWREGMSTVYSETRRLAGEDLLLLGNNDNGEYSLELNGKMLENFSRGKWASHLKQMQENYAEHRDPPISVLNANTFNTGSSHDYRAMRYGLTSGLLEDGYYSFDFGDRDHGQVWWYDEYNIDLGKPIAESRSESGHEEYQNDIWRRYFENGLSIVNSTKEERVVDLGGEYEKIHGTQDPDTNDGAIITEVDLPKEDGLVLMKTFQSLNDVIFTNGAFARFFRPDGSRVRNGFFVFEEGRKGEDSIGHIDIDGNGKRDLMVVSGNKMTIWRDDGTRYMKKYPYTASYKGQLRVALGDLNGDNAMEIYVAPDVGYPAPIKIYSRYGTQIRDDWYPFGVGYNGGYSIAVGNVHAGEGRELLIGTGKGVRPEVHLFNQFYDHVTSWFAFEQSFRGGVNVATGNVDGVGFEEIVVGSGPGKKPIIRVFDSAGVQKYPEFRAYSSFGAPGIGVHTADVDFDGKDDIIGMSQGVGL